MIRFCAPSCNCVIPRILTAIYPQMKLSGHPLRDAFSFVNRLATFSNRFIRRTWREAWRAKEDALRVRAKQTNDALSARTRLLRPLRWDDRVFIQNQGGRQPRKREKVGTMVEALDFDQYNVKVGGSGRMTKRNRRFLRLMPDVSESPQTSLPPTVSPRHETNFQHPPSTFTHVVDETSSEAIDYGQPQGVHDDVPTATHPTFVTDTNSQETDPDTDENNKSMTALSPTTTCCRIGSDLWSMGDQGINYITMLGCWGEVQMLGGSTNAMA